MASITGINSYLYDQYDVSGYSGKVNTSTERFKGTVTGYKPVEKEKTSTKAGSLSSEETKSYLTTLKDYGGKLKTSAGNLAQGGTSVLNKMTAASSKDEALSVSVTNQNDAAKLNDAKSTKNVSIQQLAASQKNTGTALTATASSGVNSGTNSFTVEKDGKSVSINVSINATDSARTAQQKTADAINKKNIGVTASVEYDSKTKKSSLVLSSTETGEKNAFTIADKAGQGNLVKTLGVDNTTQEARDARYSVNGVFKTSDKNTVDLGDGLTGTLKKVSYEEVNVSVKKDVSAITSAVKDLASNFNGLMKTTKDYGDDKGAKSLRQRMDSIASSYSSSLNQIGITRDKDGYLKVDEDKLKAAYENGNADKYLGDANSGFTQRLSQLGKSLDSNPDQYVSYKSRNNMEGVSGSSYGSGYNSSYNDYLSAYRMSQVNNLSMLFSGSA